jgi:RNA polymerase sigma factor (sigma-70 family)
MRIGMRALVVRSIQTLFDVGSVGGMTDGQLLEEFLSRRDEGAEAAFAALVALHGPMVWRICQSILPDSHAAEDAFQATFLILVRKAGSIRHRDALASWLHGVARRVALRAKAVATRRRRHEEEGAEMLATSSPAPDASHREQIELLHQEVDRLPEKYRAAVILCHIQGRTHAEAARLLKCPAGTVSVRVARARELLRARLIRRGLALPTALAGVTLLSEPASAAAIPSGLAASTIRVAMQVAAGKSMTAGTTSAAVTQLAEGVIKTMFMIGLKVTGACALLLGFAGAGLHVAGGAAQVNPGTSPPAQEISDDGQAKAKQKTIDNLKAIGLAMHNFAANTQNSSFPPAAISKDGKRLLSWRVAILPYLGQQALYDKFHLDEPWNSPHNKSLLDQMPDVYAPVIHREKLSHSTFYQVFVGPGSLFGSADGTKLSDINDGTANTIMVVEGAKAVAWTMPEDLPFDYEKAIPELGGQFKDEFHVLFSDGSVRPIRKKVDSKVIRAAITINGQEFLGGDAFDN